MKHFVEIICVKPGVITAEYTDEVFDIKEGDIFAVVGSNNGTQMCISGKYGETTICLLHDSQYDIGCLKDSRYNCHETIDAVDFAEFDYVE